MRWFGKDPQNQPTIMAKFTPQQDITPFELAVILSKCVPARAPTTFTLEQWSGLESSIKRHFLPVTAGA